MSFFIDFAYIKETIAENKRDPAKEYGKNLKLKAFASFCISAVETNCNFIFSPSSSVIALSSMIKELLSLSKSISTLFLICISLFLFPVFINTFISLVLE